MLETLGTSVEGRAIEAHVFERGSETLSLTTLVLGGFHGDEPKSVFMACRLIDALNGDVAIAPEVRWVVVPVVNPDGYERRKRRNANGIDINRNFPTSNWTRTPTRSRMFSGDVAGSEPETRAVIEAVARYRSSRIISIHSIGRHRHCNNYDGPAADLAQAMSRINRYPVTGSIGYATPGSFGTWAGVERNIPAITLELPSHHSPKRCWEDNRRALIAFGVPVGEVAGSMATALPKGLAFSERTRIIPP